MHTPTIVGGGIDNTLPTQLNFHEHTTVSIILTTLYQPSSARELFYTHTHCRCSRDRQAYYYIVLYRQYMNL